MLNLKKTTLIILSLTSAFSYAGTMGPVCSAVNVTAPCENLAWDIGGHALYMRAGKGYSGYTYRVNQINNRNSFYSAEANPKWGWGFQLEASYHYSTGNDLNVNWYHYRSGGVKNTLANDTWNYVGSTYLIYKGTSISNQPAWDQVNIEFAQQSNYGEHKFIRYHAGMNFSRIAFNGDQEISYRVAGDQVDSYDGYKYATVFNGFGPRVGMDLNYEWDSGLSAYGTAAVSVLAGTSKFSRHYTSYFDNNGAFIPGGDYNSFVSSNQYNAIGELDTKLGFMYTYSIAQGDLSLNVGWAFAQYLGGLNYTQHNSAKESDSVFNIGDTNSNFSIQGLYFGLKWIGSLA